MEEKKLKKHLCGRKKRFPNGTRFSVYCDKSHVKELRREVKRLIKDIEKRGYQ